uniref:Uncharacterized protein n=1 Tax=Leersia perrieri TaxID=77586 RepID=A0A0D9XFP1_9ORYZ
MADHVLVNSFHELQPQESEHMASTWRARTVHADSDGVVRKEEMERCVREVMEGEKSEEYMKNAADWKEKAGSAMSEGGSSDRNIIEFITKFGFKL